jgi:hypothetical protein
MKIKQSLIVAIIIIGFVVSFTLCFIAFAANDTPHNASNHIDCGSCHGEGLLQSFWGGSGKYSTVDELCLSCHTEPFGPYPETKGPFVKTHSDAGGSVLAECRDCHNPHYQRQKVYKNTDASNLYLATGTITNCVYNNNNTSTFNYSTIAYKSGWDATRLSKKTEDYRGAILFPNIGKLGYNYPITAVDDPDAKTITVNGDLTTECNNNYFNSTTFAVIYGQYIKDSIDVSTDGSGVYSAVKFLDKKGQGSFTYDESTTGTDPTPNGVCQVCHTNTTHWKSDGTAADHYNNFTEGCNYSRGCAQCHTHKKGFFHGGPCIECHGHDAGYEYDTGKYSEGDGTFQSHSTHTENDNDDLKGPNITCGDCHDISNYPYFKSGIDTNGDGKINLSETDVCDPCHSPGGAYEGVNDSVIGAKNNWCQGVYEGNTFRSGKENWCLGCHDDAPVTIKSVLAPNVAGDNVNYGYNVTGHGIYGNPSITCLGCHDPLIPHIDGNARTYVASLDPLDLDKYKNGYRLAEGMAIPRSSDQNVNTAFTLCFTCHDSTPFLTKTSSETDFRDDVNPNGPDGVKPWNFHWEHLKKSSSGKQSWDSDCNWPVDPINGDCDDDYTICSDSGISCTTCHNVHGSPCISGPSGTSIVQCTDPVRNPMIRHGELISTPGTSDRVPAFQFHWYDGPSGTGNYVTDFDSSKTGGLRVGEALLITYNHVCWGCHARGERQYTRAPRTYTLLVDESFEGPGYEEFIQGTVNSGCSLNPDFRYPDAPGTPQPPSSEAGLECLQVTATAGKQAFAKRDYGLEKPRTFTSFYLYVESENLDYSSNKNIGILDDNSGNNVFVFKLNKNASGQLRFNITFNDASGNAYFTDYANISTGRWYKIEVKYDTVKPYAEDAWGWWFDGEFQHGDKLTSMTHGYYSGIRTWNFGFMGTGTAITGTIYFDLINANTRSFP